MIGQDTANASRPVHPLATDLDELHRMINGKWNELQELLEVLATHHKQVMQTLEATSHMHSNPMVPGRG